MPRGLLGESAARYERLYSMLLDAIPSSVLVVDQALYVVSANRNFLAKSHRSMAHTIGARLDEVFPAVILDNMAIKRRIQAAFEGKEATSGERMTYRAPGLPTRVYYYSILPFVWKESVESVMLLLEDVTEQVKLSEEVRRAEQHLASIVQSASDLVLSMDTDGRILTWNAAAERISGHRYDTVRGRFFHELCSQEHQAAARDALAGMANPETRHVAEWSLVTKKGDVVPVSWVCSPMKDDQGRTVGFVGIGRDLTEGRRLEVQLLQSQKLTALGVMAGGIAHEIRNPLTICSSAAQFLLDDDVTPTFRRECAERIHTGLRRACAIIENLLHFARPVANEDVLPVDLAVVVKDTLLLIANQARMQSIEVAATFPPEPAIVAGIPGLLQQVFMNLFVNAIGAMPKGGRLSVTIRKASNEAAIEIADDGCGIPSDQLDRIYDPFYTASPAGQGTGLGLSICYSIVKRHFGSIEVESAEGEGSRFTVRLPLA